MGKHEKRVYLETIRKRYRRAKRADKSKILNEFCSVCGYQRELDACPAVVRLRAFR